ncbi:NAD(P)-binding domain-containing protein [Synoicihabitans lomoniglobus]|uniref:NAD(P)-binding domain-containing protein n=1 Tax=Synoicihabitans lomoniglobus TaxID=2909285 RepID=A0AAF0I410_9BACT|nr:NAD(P)-binding domain-containing protein [Opitutaceae bacterium LMO-M01]WED66225.1 NAD(P)-binding domain-containing protein [Opitutaceae bacterium LMO-M01]
MSVLRRYLHWLHLRWPAGRVEKLPEVNSDGTTVVPGVRVVGDLTGVPLLKFAADTGAKAANAVADELGADVGGDSGPMDLAIVGGGVAGLAAALEAKRRGLRFAVFEASAPFATIVNFPKGKPIYTYPTDMAPAGDLALRADVKEDLLAELEAQRVAAGIEPKRVRIEKLERKGDLIRLHHPGGEPFAARRVIVAIGRSGNHRKLGVPGEALGKVFNRLHDPAEFAGHNVMVVGGGDSALEAAVALQHAGAAVTLSYRGEAFTRAKPENVAAVAESGVSIVLRSTVVAIEDDTVKLQTADAETSVPNDAVFALIGREAPLDFFRRSGIPIQGETSLAGWLGVVALLLFCTFIYTWKSGGPTESWIDPAGLAASWQEQAEDRSTLIGTIAVSMNSRSFYYTLLYSSLILGFGIDRIRRRRTPYVRRQTIALMLVQWLPLFVLPEVVLPWAGYNEVFSGGGVGESVGDALFEKYVSPDAYAVELWPENGHPRAYWRAYGFILAWPLNVYNVFNGSPHWWWIGIGFFQTCVLIPWMVYRWGKGAYCGWICSCGALAETMGDRHRHKMPHGPGWNKVNVIGQVFLAAAVALLALRVVGWVLPGSWVDTHFNLLLEGKAADGGKAVGWFFSYKWFVDVLFGGVIGVGFYFKYSGRVWCRFACPLAALMHIYARFTRFRIFADKKKCISCNVCTSVCHQGIDVMAFANRGAPMEDPQCVRCSACVQSCPTGVLSFGRLLADGKPLFDELPASPVQMNEARR